MKTRLMIFRFIKTYKNMNFEMDIPVNFVVPKKFNSFESLSSELNFYNEQVSDILESMGLSISELSFRVSSDMVSVFMKPYQFDETKKRLIREQKLKQLLE